MFNSFGEIIEAVATAWFYILTFMLFIFAPITAIIYAIWWLIN